MHPVWKPLLVMVKIPDQVLVSARLSFHWAGDKLSFSAYPVSTARSLMTTRNVFNRLRQRELFIMRSLPGNKIINTLTIGQRQGGFHECFGRAHSILFGCHRDMALACSRRLMSTSLCDIMVPQQKLH